MEREEVKDKQEAAIYVFTVRCIHLGKHDITANCYIQIVTVIFLPLSFVSRILGTFGPWKMANGSFGLWQSR